jgi:hypothetical protein
MFTLWFWLRQAAVARHAVFNAVFEGSDPIKWKTHEAAIRKFYGF